jgi:hypothetical protein
MKEGFLKGIRWLGGRGLLTTRSIAHIFLRVAYDVASGLKFFVLGSDGM